MNKPRMLQLADEIERPSNSRLAHTRFDMSAIISPSNYRVGGTCDTVACAAGFACLLFGEPGREVTETYAAELLGLDGLAMVRLFYNDGGYIASLSWDGHLGQITAEETARAIRRMVGESQ